MEQRVVIGALRLFALALMLTPLFFAATSAQAGEAQAQVAGGVGPEQGGG